ncbi:hypothetical protein HGRIS_003176 [Hohenbuehelia grisea]|uniref:Uncharacterized protein n=1 Tax=Hohenbuehelia grisea TaxID=104357 RepID=A0ABR3JMN5_9AGAR
MCKQVLTHAYGVTGKKPTSNEAYIVKTKFNHHICTQFQVSGHGSCYPLEMDDKPDLKEGARCDSRNWPAIDKQVPNKVREVIAAKKK